MEKRNLDMDYGRNLLTKGMLLTSNNRRFRSTLYAQIAAFILRLVGSDHQGRSCNPYGLKVWCFATKHSFVLSNQFHTLKGMQENLYLQFVYIGVAIAVT